MAIQRSPQAIIFYDGHCPLCNRFVKWVFIFDHQGIFHFAPLEGTTAHRYLPLATGHQLPPNTVILWQKDRIAVRSSAVVQILHSLPGWQLLGRLLSLFPSKLLDQLYTFIATYRYRLFSTCPLMPPRFKSRFLP